MADYDIDMQYHPEKVNMIPDALSRNYKAPLTVNSLTRMNYSRRWCD